MSAIVNGVINSTIGILCSKLRDYTAERLNDSDVNEEKCRQIVVRELDDIKSKLDGLSRKDLLASLSFFKEGVTRLYISLETFDESCDQPGTSQGNIEDQYEVKGATATRVEQFPVTQAERDVLECAIELSEIIGNLKIASKERYKLAKKSFEEARKLATEAFNNVALRTEDRLMASKLRIASRILEGLEDLEAAVRDCLLYLKELQDLPAVQAMFAVWRDSDKGITSRLRARFNQGKRHVNIESIRMINALLIDLAMKFTNMKMGLFNWPTIMIGKAFYHPLLEDYALQRKMQENKTQFPWLWMFGFILPRHCALTSKGEILSTTTRKSLEITRRSGKCEFFTIPSENRNTRNEIRCFAVDENGNVYIVVEITSFKKNVPPRYKLLTLCANGNIKTGRFLEVIDEELWDEQIGMTKDGMIVIYCNHNETVYICDSENIRQDYKFRVSFKKVHAETGLSEFSFTVSNKDEIIFTFCKYDGRKADTDKLLVYIITMDGKIKREVQVPITTMFLPDVSAAFNHVNETILVSLLDINNENHDNLTMFSFSNTGELLHQLDILRCRYSGVNQLVSHPNGPVALVGQKEAVMFQM